MLTSKKFKAKVVAVMLAVVTMFALMPTTVVHADDAENLKLETGIDKTLEVPLTLKGSTETFYMNGNINPGDVLNASIKFTNTSTEEIQVNIASITNNLADDKTATALLDLLELKITVNDSPIYKGIHSKVTNPVTGWMPLAAGQSMTIDVEITLPKYSVDNTYQAADMNVKWVFEARADVPEDESSETIKTGVESEDPTHMGMYILIIALVIAGGFCVYTVVKKKQVNTTE